MQYGNTKREKGCGIMMACPHCRGELDDSKKYITCPHCGRVARSVEECVEALLSSGQLDSLRQKATSEYWGTITTGLRHIMFMDMETCLAVRDKLFKSPEEDLPDLSSD